MGLNQAGILSPCVGKVSGVVGFRWKDKAALRGYVIPANPRTELQVVQRTKFSECSKFASTILGQILQPLMDPFVRSMSAYNWFVQRNIGCFEVPIDYTSIIMTQGPLWRLQEPTAQWNNGTTSVDFSWEPTLGNNGLLTDKVYALVYDKTAKVMYISVNIATRETGLESVVLPITHTGANLYSWIGCSQMDGTAVGKVSDSTYCEVQPA
jgi:hypothetical protein